MNFFPSLIRLSGMFGPALLLLGGVVLFLAVRALFSPTRKTASHPMTLRAQADAVLFWGVASAILGFLGQCQGTYLALNEILAASEISSQVVAEGFVISFVPTLFGLGILTFASVVWASLRFLRRRTTAFLVVALMALATPGCDGQAPVEGVDITRGVWAFDAAPSLFLWEFQGGSEGSLGCVVHEVLDGLKFLETPCSSAKLTGQSLELKMPNGVRFQGEVDFAEGEIDGRLLYPSGGGVDAVLRWAQRGDHPTLEPRPEAAGPFVYSGPIEQGDGWVPASAENRGVDPAALERTVEAILQGEAGFLKSLLVIRGGALLLEEYFHGYGPDDLFPLHSCTKSISSLLVGLAIQEGRIAGVDVPLLDFFPNEREGAGTGWEELTLEHLLTMSLALDWTPEEAEGRHGTGPAAFREILARKVSGHPGQDWEYVNMNVNLLAGVLRQATGEPADAFAARALFEPLGISTWDWSYGKTDGFNLMDGSLRLRSRDMAKIGQMVLNGGDWQGRGVLDPEWIQASIRPHLASGSAEGDGYGYLWWIMEPPGPDGQPVQVVFANGWGSQFIFLLPELDLIVVTTGGNQENGKHLAVGQVILQHLLPGVKSGPS